jgi:hypothetical protein
MSNHEELTETLAPAVVRSLQSDRRRPGRPEHVLPGLLPMLRDPAASVPAIEGTAIKARLMALTAVCLCMALGYVLRGLP